MKINIQSIPGCRINEYMLVLNPHEELRNKIARVRREFSETYKNSTALLSKPHVALVRFTQLEMMEDRFVNRLKIVGMGFQPFKVALKDYGSFPSHTIYINITSKVPVQGLVKQIRSEAQRLMKMNDENKPHFIMEPHLTIARKLKPWQYEKGWLEYSHKHFAGRFIADSMVLLKRPVGDPDSLREKYQVVDRFTFQNLPVSTRQGQLFG
jgi:2'-5' RNA ligase